MLSLLVLGALVLSGPGAVLANSWSSCLLQPRPCAARALDVGDVYLQEQFRQWGAEADREVTLSMAQARVLAAPQGSSAGPALEAPSQAAQRLQLALQELATLLQNSIYKSMARKKSGGGGGGIESITISAGQEGGGHQHEKKKKKKKKKQPVSLHVHQQQQMQQEEEKGVHREEAPALDVLLQPELAGEGRTRVKRGGSSPRQLEEDGRGKKKKKKKAILKLLLLGAVLKAKIGLLLQLLSAHLQVKFFAIALAGLALNIARFWLDLKKGHQPQKVIYYEHAQHQHHYEHDQEHDTSAGGWGGWGRNLDTQKQEVEYVPVPSPSDEHTAYEPYGGWARTQN